jgi:hypothetical protein
MENIDPMRTFSKIFWLLALVVLSSGCAITHPTDPYAGMDRYGPGLVPDGASRLATKKRVEGPLTLDECIRIALENSPDPRAATYEANVARAKRDIAAGGRLPSVNVIGGYNHYLDSQRLIPARENGEIGVFGRDIFTGDLVVSLPLFTGGRIISEIEAAELVEKSAEHQLARTKEDVVFSVSSVFYAILAQRYVISSLEFSKKALQEHLKRIQDLLAAQRVARVDRLRTEVRIADLEQSLAVEQNLLAVQSRVLTNLMGLDSYEKPVEPVGKLVFVKTPTADAGKAIQDAFSGRPDYLAARAALEAQARTVDAARAARMLRAEVYLDGDDMDGLSPGAYVPLRVILGGSRHVTLVPAGSVIESPDRKPYVFIVHDSHLTARPISILGSSGGEVAVEGVRAGEQVVLSTFL